MAKTFLTKLLNKMSEKGLEPSKISPYAPETYVSTSSTTPTNQFLYYIRIRSFSSSNFDFLIKTLNSYTYTTDIFSFRVCADSS